MSIENQNSAPSPNKIEGEIDDAELNDVCGGDKATTTKTTTTKPTTKKIELHGDNVATSVNQRLVESAALMPLVRTKRTSDCGRCTSAIAGERTRRRDLGSAAISA